MDGKEDTMQGVTQEKVPETQRRHSEVQKSNLVVLPPFLEFKSPQPSIDESNMLAHTVQEKAGSVIKRGSAGLRRWRTRHLSVRMSTVTVSFYKDPQMMRHTRVIYLKDIEKIEELPAQGRRQYNFVIRYRDGPIRNAEVSCASEQEKNDWIMSILSHCLLQAVKDHMPLPRINTFLGLGANPNINSSTPVEPLVLLAFHKNYPEAGQSLLKYGANIHSLLRWQVQAESSCPLELIVDSLVEAKRSNDLASVADDCTGWNVLHHAVRVGDFALIKKLLSVLPQNAKDAITVDGDSPVLLAVKLLEEEVALRIVDLLSPTSDLMRSDRNGDQPLHISLKRLYFDVASLLVENGAGINTLDSAGHSALHLVYMTGRKELLHKMLEKDIDVDQPNKQGITLLSLCVEAEDEDLSLKLLERGANPNVEASKLQIPKCERDSLLHLSIKKGLSRLSKALIHRGADLSLRDTDGNTPLLLTLKKEMIDLAQDLVEVSAKNNPELLNEQDTVTRDPPLYLAIRARFWDLAMLLIKCGASSSVQNIIGYNGLHHVVRLVRENSTLLPISTAQDICKALFKNGADPTQTTTEIPQDAPRQWRDISVSHRIGETPLHMAARFGIVDLVDLFLLTDQSLANAWDEKGNSALIASIEAESEAIAQRILKNNIPINYKSSSGSTPLHLSIMKGFRQLSATLFSKGSLATIWDASGNAPIHLTAETDHVDIFDLCIANNCDVNMRNERGWPIAFIAAKHGSYKILERLFQNPGFDPFLVLPETRDTLIHFVSKLQSPNTQVVEVILRYQKLFQLSGERAETCVTNLQGTTLHAALEILQALSPDVEAQDIKISEKKSETALPNLASDPISQVETEAKSKSRDANQAKPKAEKPQESRKGFGVFQGFLSRGSSHRQVSTPNKEEIVEEDSADKENKERARLEEEEKLRLEEEKRQEEEKFRLDEEKRKEEERLKLEEEKRQEEEKLRLEEEKRQEEEKFRLEEEKRQEEEKLRLEEEQATLKIQAVFRGRKIRQEFSRVKEQKHSDDQTVDRANNETEDKDNQNEDLVSSKEASDENVQESTIDEPNESAEPLSITESEEKSIIKIQAAIRGKRARQEYKASRAVMEQTEPNEEDEAAHQVDMSLVVEDAITAGSGNINEAQTPEPQTPEPQTPETQTPEPVQESIFTRLMQSFSFDALSKPKIEENSQEIVARPVSSGPLGC